MNPFKIEIIDENFQATCLFDLHSIIPSEYIKMLTNRVMTDNTQELFQVTCKSNWESIIPSKRSIKLGKSIQ